MMYVIYVMSCHVQYVYFVRTFEFKFNLYKKANEEPLRDEIECMKESNLVSNE
jgi:hypothetical protein